MNYRDEFAKAALTGLLASGYGIRAKNRDRMFAYEAYTLADAMMEMRHKDLSKMSRPSAECCESRHKGCYCCLPDGHSGEHMATDDSEECVRWD